jgi:hypothetical protein
VSGRETSRTAAPGGLRTRTDSPPRTA